MAGETNIGGIVGFLRLEADQFHREIQQALLEVAALDDKDVRVKVRADGAAGLERLPAAARAAGKSVDDLAVSEGRVEDATKRVNLATLKLSELRETGKAKASQLMQAELNLAKARRDERDAIYATYDANINLGRAVEQVVHQNEDNNDRNKKVKQSADQARQSSGLLMTTVIGLGPALVPIAGGAVTLAAGFAGMATAGILAFKGISDAMSKNNDVGRAYQTGLTTLRVGMEGLAATAANNLLGPFQRAVEDVTAKLPGLNGQIGDLTTLTGKAAGAVINGLLSAFQQLEPVMRTGATYVVDLADRFDALMSGPGIVSFGQYVQSVLPQVMSVLGSLVTTASNLIQALAPLGGGVLQSIGMLADLINRIPVDVLSSVATLAYSVYIGFKVWSSLGQVIDSVAGAMTRLKYSEEGVATATRSMQAAAGIIGIALAGLSIIMQNQAEDTRKSQQLTDDYTEALIRNNGAIDDSITAITRKHLADSGVADAARDLNYNLQDVTLAAQGNAPAMERVAKHTQAVRDSFAEVDASGADVTATYGNIGNELELVTGFLGKNNTALQNGQQAQKNYADMTAGAAGQTDGLSTAIQNQANAYGVNVSTWQTAIDQQQKLADKAAAAKLQMQLEGDAAGLLKQQLDELNGKAMSEAQAQNAFERAQLSVSNPVKSAAEAEARAKAAYEAATGKPVGVKGKQSAQNSLDKANLAQSQAQDHLNRMQATGKATASQLEAAHQRLARASMTQAQADGRVAGLQQQNNQASIDAAKKTWEQAQAATAAAKAITGQSDAAVTNRGNLLTAITDAENWTEAYRNHGHTAEDTKKKLEVLRDQIIKNAVAQGMDKDEVTKFVTELLKVPDKITPVQAEIDTAAALKKAKALQDAIDAIKGRTVPITVMTTYKDYLPSLQMHNERTLAAHGGNPNLQANGGIFQGGVRKMAEGGFAGRESTIMRSTNPILWNEAPGGEAYISLAPEKRARSLAIHSQVGALLGANGGGGSRMHPDDIGMLARRIGDEIRRMPTPQIGINQLDAARGGY